MPSFRNYFPPRSKRIAAKGGIKARSKRGAFATSWWGQRWLNVLETLNLGGRLARARTYARKGQVLDVEIQPTSVTAKVQGSQPTPYRIRIGVTPLAKAERARLAAELARSPYVLAKLLAGEMPQDIETLFSAAEISLFPARASELETDCSCPDWSNPCKHIAAVYYLLGEEFDRDPFLIFRLRGIELAELAAGLETVAVAEEPVVAADVHVLVRGKVPPDGFWEGTRPEVDLSVGEVGQSFAPLLLRLGNLPFWRGEAPLRESLEPGYARARARAVELLAGSSR
jgi:uncharacterized Zn finger protein